MFINEVGRTKVAGIVRQKVKEEIREEIEREIQHNPDYEIPF